jgi:hypothetical protein
MLIRHLTVLFCFFSFSDPRAQTNLRSENETRIDLIVLGIHDGKREKTEQNG